MFVSDLDKHGIVHFIESNGAIMCAGTKSDKISAVILTDTVNEAELIALEHGLTEYKVRPTTLFSLCDDWRYFMYRGACRMIVAGEGWLSRAVGELPQYGSQLTSDPSCSVVCARHRDNGWLTKDGGIVIAQDIADLLDELGLEEQLDNDLIEFICRPLIMFAALDERVWYQGNKYDVRESLARNSYMLSKFVDVDEEAALINRLKEESHEN